MKESDLKELGEAILKETRSEITPKQLIKAVPCRPPMWDALSANGSPMREMTRALPVV